ncbi:helix-turn-helix transcriptional regulator [Granulicoccus phenolivorans]|uniref:helix-turn-helix transcriptional regulator n=1 Tax=Granulicoccus phenolivorans TaxID=266854 RepID=UPI00272ECD21|nr:HTH domain-containing protein [Granulicoccus phenolivorans]
MCRQGRRRTFQELAHELGVTPRTVARDIQRLRHSGVPISVTPGRAGGAVLAAATEPLPLRLDVAEIAALISSLAAVGPTVSEPARSAMKMLVDALSPPDTRGPSGGSSNAPD